MKYKFLGKPDDKFPELITGKIYYLKVRTDYRGRPKIVDPFYCPYSKWETFYQNWKPITMKSVSGKGVESKKLC